jgi:hypothetical protein
MFCLVLKPQCTAKWHVFYIRNRHISVSSFVYKYDQWPHDSYMTGRAGVWEADRHVFSYVMCFRTSCVLVCHVFSYSCVFVRHVFSYVMCFCMSCVFACHVFSYVMCFRTHDVWKHMTYENTWRTKTHDIRKHMTTKAHDIRKHMMCENTWRMKTHSVRKHMTYERMSCVFVCHVFSYVMCCRMSCVFVLSLLFWFAQRTHYFLRVFRFLFMERKQDYNVTSVKNVKVYF